MPSGKTHAIIGVSASVIVGYAMTMNDFQFSDINSIQAAGMHLSNTARFMIPMISGAVIGSLIVDIDSKRSKASQFFAKSLTLIVVLFTLFNLLFKYGINLNGTTTLIGKLLEMIVSYFTSSTGMIMFSIFTILGKLSPHRGFTHKWFGTTCFLTSAFFSMNRIMFIGFSIGYILHLIADNYLTKEKIYFKKFRLPCQNANGKINIVW